MLLKAFRFFAELCTFIHRSVSYIICFECCFSAFPWRIMSNGLLERERERDLGWYLSVMFCGHFSGIKLNILLILMCLLLWNVSFFYWLLTLSDFISFYCWPQKMFTGMLVLLICIWNVRFFFFYRLLTLISVLFIVDHKMRCLEEC